MALRVADVFVHTPRCTKRRNAIQTSILFLERMNG